MLEGWPSANDIVDSALLWRKSSKRFRPPAIPISQAIEAELFARTGWGMFLKKELDGRTKGIFSISAASTESYL
jgi:hypothetical protein